MYKIRELAKILNVETVEIHKKLISLKKELTGHVEKNNGIISVDAEGLEIISLSLTGKRTGRSELSTVNDEDQDVNFTEKKEEELNPPELSEEESDEERQSEFSDLSEKVPQSEVREEVTEVPEASEVSVQDDQAVLEPETQDSRVREDFHFAQGALVTEQETGDSENLKSDHYSKKVELNLVNQQIMNELEKTKNYTKELNDVYDKIAKILK